MKKLLFLLIAMVFSSITWGQNMANYTFSSATNGSLIDISTGATSLMSGNQDDNGSTVQNIGFTFYFMSVPYTQFSANSNGQIRLGSTVVGGSNISSYSASKPIIAPMGGDNEVNNGMSFKVIGTAPDRILVVEWNQFYVYYTNITTSGNMQALLYEGSGKIEFIYGDIKNSSSSSVTRPIFISASNTTTKSGSVTVGATPTFETTATTPVSNTFAADVSIADLASTADGSRVVYTFTPPTVPTDPTWATTAFTAITPSEMTLNWDDNSSNEIGFLVYRSLNDTTYTLVTTTAENVTSYVATGLLSGTTYYWKVAAFNEGAVSYTAANSQATIAIAAPTTFTATNVSGTMATIGWTDNSTTENAFRVKRATTLNGTYTQQGSDIVSTDSVGTGVTYSLTQTGLSPSTNYYYRIYAYAGAESPYLQDSITTTIRDTADAAPINFTATSITSDGMTIGWTDNSTDEFFFRVYRSTSLSTGYTQIGSDINSTSIATTGTTYSQVQTGLMAGTKYYYRIVAAVDSESPYLIDSVTTDPPVPMTGIWTIDPAGSGPNNFTSFTNAINYLNANGVGTGGVTFNVASGANFTESNMVITVTGTATDPITFQKNGVGVNPKITASTGISTSTDGIIKIAGGDYITFDGIDLAENVANITTTTQMEWGYALVKESATAPFNGCQYVTIKNCNITLNKTNTNSRGIYAGNHIVTTTSTLTITAATDAMNNCKFFNNTISNVYGGIYINGYAASSPYTLYDSNNEIGVDGANNIFNLGGAGSSVRAIYGNNQKDLKIANNTVNSSLDGLTSTGYGIFTSTGTSSNVDIYNNTITLSYTTGAYATNTIYGINNAMGSTPASNTVNIYGNTISGCYLSAATSGNFQGIVNSATAKYVNIHDNTIDGTTLAGTGDFIGIYNSAAMGTDTLTMYANNISNNVKNGASGNMYCVRAATATINFYSNNINDNNAAGTSTFYGYYNVSSPVTETYHDNNIFNLTHEGTGTLTGIQISTAVGVKNIYGNNIYGLTSGGPVNGYTSAYGAPANIYKNNIHSLTTTGTSTQAIGINFSGPIGNIYNNFISDINATASTNVNGVIGINLAGTTQNVYYNTVYLNATSSSTTTFGTSGIYATVAPTVDLRNNIVVNNSTPVGDAYSVAYRRSSRVLTTYSASSDYNCFYTSGGTNMGIYADSTAFPAPNYKETFADYKTYVATRDAASFSEMPPFIFSTPDDLHLDPTISTGCESGGIRITTPDITADIDGDVRFGETGYTGTGTTTDVGADEFEGTPAYTCGTPNPDSTLASANALCFGNSTILSLKNATIGTGIGYQWQSSVDDVTYTDISGEITSTYAATPSIATYYKCNVTCQNGPVTVASIPVYITFVNNVASTTPATRCGTGTVDLAATAGGTGTTLSWYADSIGGTVLDTGNLFTTPIISSTTNYYVSEVISAPANISIGAGASTSATYSNPFYSLWSNLHEQHLITAAELTAAGLGAGNITSVALDVTSAGTLPMINLSVKIGTTTAINMSNFVDNTGFIEIYTNASLMPTIGLNVLTFSTPFYWDGTSNIILEFCHGNGSSTATMSRTVKTDATAYISSIKTHAMTATSSATICGNTTSNVLTYSVRPQFTFAGQTVCSSPRVAVTATVTPPPALTISADQTICNDAVTMMTVTSDTTNYDTYVWTPVTGLFTDAAATIPYITDSSATTVYVKTSTAGTISYVCSASNAALCAKTDTTLITVLPANPVISASPNSLCISGTTILTTTPSTGYGAATFQWQNSPDSIIFSDIVGHTSLKDTTDILTATTYYRLVIKDGTGNTCVEPTITVVVNNPQVLTTTPATRCGIGTVTLEATASAGATLQWYADSIGGTAIGTGSQFTTPSITATTNYYVDASNIDASEIATIGNGTATSSDTYTPFNGGYGGIKTQHLFTAAELTAANIRAGNISGLSLEVTAIGTTYNGFYIQMGNTALNDFTATANIQGGLTTVYDAASVTPTVGINAYTFTNPFIWDGVSNVIVSISWSNGNTSNTASTVKVDPTTNYSSQSYRKDSDTPANILAFTGSSYTTVSSQNRPQIKFNYTPICLSTRTPVTATVTPPPALTITADQAVCNNAVAMLSVTSDTTNYDMYVWTPATELYTDALTTIPYIADSSATTVYMKPTINGAIVYTCTANNSLSLCSNATTTTVTVNPIPTSITASANNSTICSGNSINLTSSSNSNSLITFISPTDDGGFESGSDFASNNWTVVNAASNYWIIGNLAPAYEGSQGAHISQSGTAYDYTTGTTYTSHLYRDITIPTGSDNISLSFYWKGSGESGWDRMLIYTAPTSVTPVQNEPASDATTLTGATLVWTQPNNAQSTYTLATVSLPDSLAGTTVRLIFTWQNDAADGVTPPIAIDNISLTANMPTNCTYLWNSNPIGFTSTDQNPTGIIQNVTTQYTVTAQNSFGCTDTASTTVTVVTGAAIDIQPLPAIKCTGQTATYTVTAIGPGLIYQWRKNGVDIDIISNPSAATATLSLTNVSTADTGNYDVVVTATCGAPVTSDAVALTVNPIPTASASSNSPVCSGSTLLLTGTTDIGDTYAWTGPDGFTSTSQNPSISLITTAATGKYLFTATLNGCTSTTDTTTVTIDLTPSVTIMPATPNICVGSVQQLDALISLGSTITIGNATTLTTANSTEPTAFNNRYKQYWAQMVFTAAELQAAGLSAGNITSISFNITTLGDASNVTDFRVSLGATDSSTLTGFTTTGLTQVYGPSTYSHTIGTNLITFTTPYTWDGISNILVDLRQTGADASNNARTYYTETTGNTVVSAAVSYSSPDLSTNNPSATTSKKRLNTVFGFNKPTTTTWAPTDSLYIDASATVPYTTGTAATTVYAKPSVGTIDYTATATAVTTGCSSGNTVTVTVAPPSIGGTATATNPTVCSGTGTTITLTGNTGNIQWQSSLDGTTWNDITGETSATLLTGNITATNYYKAIVTSGICTSDTSTVAMVTIDPVSVGGNITGDEVTVCEGNNSTVLTLSGYTGNVVKWQSSLDGSIWTDIAITIDTCTATNLTATTLYRAVVQSGVCTEAYSDTATININPKPTASIIPAQSICIGDSILLSVTLTGTAPWNITANNGVDPDIIVSGITTSPWITWEHPTTLTTYSVVSLTDANCTNTDTVSTVVTVNPLPIPTISGLSTVCAVSTDVVYSTEAGMTNYVWNVSGGGTITGGGTPTDNTVTISWNTFVPQTVSVSYTNGNGCTAATPTVYNIAIDPINVGGTLSHDTIVCSTTNSIPLILTGNIGNITSWESSTDGTSWTPIANTINTYTATNVAVTTQFRVVVQSGVCVPAYSDTVTITVNTPPALSVIGTNPTACGASDGSAIAISPTAISYSWNTSPVQTNDTATGLIAGNYFVTVFDGVCTNEASVTLSDPGAPTVTLISDDTTICAGQLVTFTAGGATTYEFFVNGVSQGAPTTTATYTSSTLINGNIVTVRGITAGCTGNSTGITMVVDPVSVGGTLAGSTIVCSGTNSTILTLNSYTGNIIGWESSTDGSTWNPIVNTINTYTATNLTTTTQYRVVVQSGVCSTANSTAATITVDPISVGGAVTGSATVCSGTNSTLLTLAGHIGNVVKWQSSPNGTTWTDIANTTTTYTATDLTITTQYRAVVQSGVCSTANSTAATVTVDPVSVGGTVTGGATVCSGTNSTLLTLAGHTGNVVKWQSSPNGTTWTDIANTTTTYTATDLTATTQYRAVVQSGVCATANSAATTVTVDPVSVGGTITGSAAVCSGTNSTLLTLAGHTGNVVKWQSSPNGTTWTDIANTTTTYTATDLTTTTQYRAVVQSGVCSTANSTVATVTVDPVSVGGAVTGGAAVCSGTNSTLLTLAGHTGNVVKWQSSPNGTTWTDIANTTTTYTATNLTATTQYRAVVQSGVCATANSTAATVTVDPVSVGGAVTGSATVCSGTNSTLLTLAGHIGNVVKWQSSPNGTTWTDIANTNTTYTATNITATTQYRAVVQSGVCATSNSTAATVTVDPVSVGGTVTGSATVCSGTNSTLLTLAGHTGNVVKWQSSPNGTTWTDIANTTTTYTATNLTATTQYRAVVQSGVCATANSTAATVTVDPVSVGGAVTGSATVCEGTNSTVLTLTGNTGNVTKWQSSPNGTTWTDIANTTITYTATNLTATTQYRAVVQSGVCSSANSTAATITVNPLPAAAGTITSVHNDSVSINENNVLYTVPVIANATSYIWSYTGTGVTFIPPSATTITDSVRINFSATATSGDLTVKGHNTCGDGVVSSIYHIYVSSVGIGEIANSLIYQIYPNPTKGIITINIDGINTNIDLQIINVQGKVIRTEKITKDNQSYTQDVDLSTYPKGIYFVKITNKNFTKVEKVVLQ